MAITITVAAAMYTATVIGQDQDMGIDTRLVTGNPVAMAIIGSGAIGTDNDKNVHTQKNGQLSHPPNIWMALPTVECTRDADRYSE
jgi:hypothetical protein